MANIDLSNCHALFHRIHKPLICPTFEPRGRAIFVLSLLFVLVLASRRFSEYYSLIFSKNSRFQIVWGRGRRSTIQRMCHLLFLLQISQITLFYGQFLTGCIAGSCVSNKSAVTRTEENSRRVSTMLHSFFRAQSSYSDPPCIKIRQKILLFLLSMGKPDYLLTC